MRHRGARSDGAPSDPLLDGSTQGQCCWFELSRTAVVIVLFALASLAIALVVAVIALLLKNYQEYGIGVTPTGSDPYATGRFVPCIYGSFPCLWNWNMSSTDWGYVCTLGNDCPNDSGARPTLSVVMATLGEGEAEIIESSMRAVSVEVHQVFCDRVLHGLLRSHKILLVTVTHGRDRASVCMSDLLRLYGRLIKEVIFVGTGRFSPRAGGILDSSKNCSQAAPALEPAPKSGPAVKLSLIGDVCISSITSSWDCQRCADDDDPNLVPSDSTPWWSACRKMHCELRSVAPVADVPPSWGVQPAAFAARAGGSRDARSGGGGAAAPGPRLKSQISSDSGDVPAMTPSFSPGSDAADCEYWSQTTELYDVAHSLIASDAPPAAVSGELRDFIVRYWRAMSQGATQDYSAVLRDTPIVLGDGECAEASSETRWRGAPYDELARRAVSQAMAHAYAGLERSGPRPPPVAVSAREGAGWTSVLAVRERYLDRPIPFVNIRAASGYTHEPVHFVPEYGAWRETLGWLNPDEHERFRTLAHDQASEIAARAVLRLFDARRPAVPPDLPIRSGSMAEQQSRIIELG